VAAWGSNAAVNASTVAAWGSNAAAWGSNATSSHTHADKYFTGSGSTVFTASNVHLGANLQLGGGQLTTTGGILSLSMSNATWNNGRECRIINHTAAPNAILYLAISPKHDTGFGRGHIQLVGFGYCNNISQGLQPLNFVSRLGVNSSNPGSYWFDCRGAANADSISESNVLLTDKYSPSNHVHAAAAVTGLAPVATSGSYASLSDVPTTFAPSAHSHTMADLGAATVRLGDMGFNGLAGVCHSSVGDARNDYALLQELGGVNYTYVNAPAGGRLKFRLNNIDQVELLPGFGATRSALNWPLADPGRMLQVYYGAGDAYGLAQHAVGALRLFMSSHPAATVSISKCVTESDSAYTDLLTIDTNARLTIKGNGAQASGIYWNYGGSKIFDDLHLRFETDDTMTWKTGTVEMLMLNQYGLNIERGGLYFWTEGDVNYRWRIYTENVGEGGGFNQGLGNLNFLTMMPDGYFIAGFIEDDVNFTIKMNFTGSHRCVREPQAAKLEEAVGLIVIASGP
jgi:hypothetical protein